MTTLLLIVLASAAYFALKAHGLRVIDAEDCPETELMED
jgi:hypothetical protein